MADLKQFTPHRIKMALVAGSSRGQGSGFNLELGTYELVHQTGYLFDDDGKITPSGWALLDKLTEPEAPANG